MAYLADQNSDKFTPVDSSPYYQYLTIRENNFHAREMKILNERCKKMEFEYTLKLNDQHLKLNDQKYQNATTELALLKAKHKNLCVERDIKLIDTGRLPIINPPVSKK
jgi:hypothetical protein